MIKYNKLVCISLFIFHLAATVSFAASLSVDDFLPPVQAETPQKAAELSKVAKPDEVKQGMSEITGTKAISAASAQDAINAYIQQRSEGFSALEFPSGIGFVATGVGTYENHANVVAARIDQRNAYVKAYIHAKKNLAAGFYGISNEGKTKLNEYMKTIDSANEATLANLNDNLSEQTAQIVEGMIRGYVVYEVHDDFEKHTVYVTIVTTPKTQGHYTRPSADSILASSIREGLAQVFSEIQSGLTPPVGGKTILVPQTGELAFVGFGSDVVRQNPNNALQSKMNLKAQQIARARSIDALCGVILGDSISSTYKVDAQSQSITKEFEEISKDDPISQSQKDSVSYKALEKSKTEFLATQADSSSISSMRKGILPPGVNSKAWMNDDKTIAYSVAIYMPSVSKQADDARKTMQQGNIVQPLGDSDSPNTRELPKGELKQGPSGQVQSNDTL